MEKSKVPIGEVVNSDIRSWLRRMAVMCIIGGVFVAFVMWMQPDRYSPSGPLAPGTYDYKDFGFDHMQMQDGVFSARLLMQGIRPTEKTILSNQSTRFILLTGRTSVGDFYKHISKARYGFGMYALEIGEGGAIIEIRETAADAFP